MKYLNFSSIAATGLLLLACSGNDSLQICAKFDQNCDGIPDALGNRVLYPNGDWAQVDFNGDGIGDGLGVDRDGDGIADGILIDTDGDGLGDAIDADGDGFADVVIDENGNAVVPTTDVPATGTGGSGSEVTGTGGAAATGGDAGTATGGSTASGGGVSFDPTGCELLDERPELTGNTTARYFDFDVTRGSAPYTFLTNGWGDGWSSHNLKYTPNGTAFEVVSLTGTASSGAPAGYPAVFCGNYSGKTSGSCGLPAQMNSLTSLKTAMRWDGPAAGEYNVSWDVWMGTGGNHDGYFMVWLRDPQKNSPAGSIKEDNVQVAGQPGSWNIYAGYVNGKPIVNYTRTQGADLKELSFDLIPFLKDAQARGYNFGGTQILSVAGGFEIWESTSGISLDDFCVDVQ